jgi:hypothetical protein
LDSGSFFCFNRIRWSVVEYGGYNRKAFVVDLLHSYSCGGVVDFGGFWEEVMVRYFFVLYKDPKGVDDRENFAVVSLGELLVVVGWVRAIISAIAILKMDFDAITLKPFIISKKILSMRMFVHEFTHLRQQEDDGLIKFCIKYVWGWIKNFFFKEETRFDFFESYREISYEIEAREAAENFRQV